MRPQRHALGAAHDDIGGAIADDRTGRAPEIRHDQLAHLTVGDRLAGGGIDHLAQVFRLVEVQKPGALPALEADRPDLGQPVMIDHARAPAPLDALARRGDAAARLARDDHHAHAALAAQRDAALAASSSAATSASRSAYVGVQHTTVGVTDSIIASRNWLDMPPPGTQCAPI